MTLKDFEYQEIILRKPDGSLMTAFKIVDLLPGEKGQISNFSKKSKSKRDIRRKEY